MRFWLHIMFGLVSSVTCIAQAPIINDITPNPTYPNNQVIISGSGFNPTASQMQVWFDQVSGTIVSSTEYSIVVKIPAQARLGNVQVVNLSNGLSAKAPIKFISSFGGVDFDPTKLSAPLTFSGGTNEIFDVGTGDFDGDGNPDLVATKQGTATDLLLLRNTSSIGSLSFVSSNLTTASPMANVACGDLNGDGKPEIVASRSGATRNEVFIFKNSSTPGTFNFATPAKLFLDAGQFAFRISIRDLNLDGKPELIVTNSNVSAGNNIIYVYVNQSSGGNLIFNTTPIKIPVSGATTTYGLDVQDLNGDHRPDIIVSQFNNSDLFIIPNTSSFSAVTFDAVQKIALTGTLNHLTSADFNNDGKQDVVVTSAFDKKAFVLLNTTASSSITFASALPVDTGDGPFGVDVSDIDGDGDVDIIIGNIDLNTSAPDTEVTVLRNNGNTTNPSFTTLNINTGKKSRNVRVGDLDGDGKPEIAYTTVNFNSLDILRNTNCFVPQILNESPITICTGQTIRLNAKANPGATIYDWKESGTTVLSGPNAFVDITAAGNYTVTTTSESGACTTTSTILNVASGSGSLPADPVTADLSSNSPACTGNTLSLGTTLSGSFSYEWEGPNGFTSSQQNPVINSASGDNAGLYSLRLSNGTCKTNAATIQIDIANLQNFAVTSSLSVNTICEGTQTTLTVNSLPDHTYQWLAGGSDISGQTGTTLNVSQSGSYSVRVTNTTLGCSVETNKLDVAVVALPVVDFTVKSPACVGENLIFTSTSQVDANGGPASFNWEFGDGGTGNSATITHAYSSAQKFIPKLTVSYSGISNCSASLSKNVDVVAAVQPVLTSTSEGLCANETAEITVTGDFAVINWDNNSTGSPLIITTAGTYKVNTIDQNGCSSSAEITIDASETPVITVTSDVSVLAPGQSAQLQASGANTYSWTPVESLSNATIANPVATPQITTTYTVTGIASNECSATQTIAIEVNSDLSGLKVPNVFSPNGDSFNDLWIIPGIEAFADCTVSLFDKNGRQIIEQKGYVNDWDGTYNGQLVPEGTYYFVIGCPDKKQLTGNVLVAR